MSQIHLSFIYTQNYKNLMGQFNLNNLNLFIGSNGSGKSNLINSFKFLKNCIIPVADSSQGVSIFEDAISKIGSSKILDINVEKPALVRFAYGFSNLANPPENCVLDLSLFVPKQQLRVSIYKEYLYIGSSLHEHLKDPFYYYKLHDQLSGKGTVFDEHLGMTEVENISNTSLALNSELLQGHDIKTLLLSTISNWQFYNANNMDLKEIRESEPKIGGGDIYLSSSCNNLALVIENLINQDLDFEERLNEAIKLILPQTRRIRSIRSERDKPNSMLENGGLINFLRKHFPNCTFERKTPIRKKPGGKANKPNISYGKTGISLIAQIKEQLPIALKNEPNQCSLILIFDDLDCRNVEQQKEEFVKAVNKVFESSSIDLSKPPIFVAFAAPEIESWLIADWDNSIAKHTDFRINKRHEKMRYWLSSQCKISFISIIL
ncbi:hypothetical protein VB715_19835 [Crocosphaera sp. UHCC 0190]|uniref:AAA family ATPase n=1 Tax=Crocosphaera sp. UHCC 0190 TaxID=3110246 RepID=UPI002B206E68|nr:hypothetical protein [Crocosphaera sp. UHCC 0190]MEA5512027.1 hypothetical protein [Crocosphaera sp. UHCC 0190]